MIDEKYLCDGEEIDDIRYEEGTFISFRKNNDSFTLEGNVAGLKSFIKILNKLLRKYNYVLLRDGFISDYYIYNADYFFDCPSLPLMIIKVKNTDRIFYDVSIMNYPEVKSICLYLKRSDILNLKLKILELIENKYDNFKFEIFDLNSEESLNFNVNKIDVPPIRL